jgi:3-deoxy-manno-octulosonate cytidylyltransferase (CMP-KDO synthetase)
VSFSVIIPARYQSERLPGKPLLEIAGQPMIQRVYDRVVASDAADVVIATDDERVREVVEGFGGKCCMTSPDHLSGTDRLQEVCQMLGLPRDHIVVNVQGDEPLIPPAVINQVAGNLIRRNVEIATLCELITTREDLFDPNIVKLVMTESGRALYFSRAPIPWGRDTFATLPDTLPDDSRFYRHLGLYAYRVKVLDQFVSWRPSPLETTEKLEQLRALWHGLNIHVELACETLPPGVDTLKDLERVRKSLQ